MGWFAHIRKDRINLSRIFLSHLKGVSCYDSINGTQIGQWKANKVVSSISTFPLDNNGKSTVINVNNGKSTVININNGKSTVIN